MAVKGILKIDGKKYQIIGASYNFSANVDQVGYPGNLIRCMPFKIKIASGSDTFFLQWMFMPSLQKSGTISYFEEEDLIKKIKQITFNGAFCISYKEVYHWQSKGPMIIELIISAGGVKIDEATFRYPWFKGPLLDDLDTYWSDADETIESIVETYKKKLQAVEKVKEPIGKMELDEVVVMPEENMEKVVLQEVVVEPDKPGFFKKYIVSPLGTGIFAVTNTALNMVAVGIVNLIPKQVATYLSDTLEGNQLIDKSWDGKMLNCENCNTSGNCKISSETKAPKTPSVSVPGKKPVDKNGNSCSGTNLKKYYYINGINTTPEANCSTSKLMSKTLCGEVFGVYNRTEGTTGDLMECVKNIRKARKLPSTDAMVNTIKNHFGTPPTAPFEELNLLAHSQGGLITQQALVEYKNNLKKAEYSEKEIEKIMSNINVKSFGTAENGWPSGPHYEQFTNFFDPVPHVINSAQMTYHDETFTPDTFDADIKRHRIYDPNFDPIKSHSVDKVYMDKLKETIKEKPISKDFKCASCVK